VPAPRAPLVSPHYAADSQAIDHGGLSSRRAHPSLTVRRGNAQTGSWSNRSSGSD